MEKQKTRMKLISIKKFLFKQHTLSILVVSTAMTPPRSQLMCVSPAPRIPLCLSWRKEFLTFWYCCFCRSLETGRTLMRLLSSGAACNQLSPFVNTEDGFTCYSLLPPVLCILFLVSFLSSSHSPESSLCVHAVFKGSIPPFKAW